MSVQKPDAFKRSLAQSYARITRLYADLPLQYASAYEASLRPRVGESAGKVTASEVSDPTGEVGFDHPAIRRPTSHAGIRRALEGCGRHMADAENSMKAAEREILKAMDRLDPREGFEPLRYPVSVSQADLEASREAQARRKERGDMA